MEQSDDNLEKVTQSDGSLGNAQVETREISPQGRYIRVSNSDIVFDYFDHFWFSSKIS